MDICFLAIQHPHTLLPVTVVRGTPLYSSLFPVAGGTPLPSPTPWVILRGDPGHRQRIITLFRGTVTGPKVSESPNKKSQWNTVTDTSGKETLFLCWVWGDKAVRAVPLFCSNVEAVTTTTPAAGGALRQQSETAQWSLWSAGAQRGLQQACPRLSKEPQSLFLSKEKVLQPKESHVLLQRPESRCRLSL